MDLRCVLRERIILLIKANLARFFLYSLYYKKLNFCSIQPKKKNLSYPRLLIASLTEDVTFTLLNKETKSGQKYSGDLTTMASKLFYQCSNHSY